ncbi:MAG: hypothetical protein NC309_03760 [Ruminococcus sp.]|nr:hypothetical protein [Ruminococcus sp.]
MSTYEVLTLLILFRTFPVTLPAQIGTTSENRYACLVLCRYGQAYSINSI